MAKRRKAAAKTVEDAQAEQDAVDLGVREAEPVIQGRKRADELLGDKDLEADVRELMAEVGEGFQNQWERGNEQLDYWDIYDGVLSGKQGYAGNSVIYLPIVHDAINARTTRFVNQVFPRSQRNVDCISSDEKPYAIMALIEHYVRRAKLRTQVMPALMRNGDVEGQYNIYVGWDKTVRHVVYKGTPKVEVEGEEIEVEGEDENDFDLVEEELESSCPTVEVLADCDVLVLPESANSVSEALSKGGSATVIRRWSKGRIKQAIDDGEVSAEEGKMLIEQMSQEGPPGQPNAQNKHIDAAGINARGKTKELTLYETWTRLNVDGARRLCRIYYAGGDNETILSIKRNPYWNDRCPLLSAPIEKVSGAFKGRSKVAPVDTQQYAANDTINEAMDSAAYALMPIVMTDPTKNPRVGSMVLNLAAIWETNPNDTKFAEFPQLWKDGFALVSQLKTSIFQSLSVSPAGIPQSTGGDSRRNQAEIANEQQVDLLSTADVCTNLEDEILTPLLRWFVELDYQYRDRPITVKQYGQMGIRANMEQIPPLTIDKRYEFRWFGVEAARNAQMMQQQIATMNVIRGIPPQQYQGYTLNMVPIISAMVENSFGPRLSPEIFRDIKSQLSLDAETENDFLIEGLTLPIHELDDDRQHMQIHLQAMQTGDPTGSVREHLMMHRFQMEKKLQMQAASIATMQQPQGMPGIPGGAGPGVAGTPRIGAQPGQVRSGQQPPGAIHNDRLQDAMAAPRR